MKEKEFATVLLDAKILSLNEITLCFKLFNTVLATIVGFPKIGRLAVPAHRCGRFETVKETGWHVR